MEDLLAVLGCLRLRAAATTPDATGHIFVYRNCPGEAPCDRAGFCGRVMSLLETEVNNKVTLEKLLTR